MKLNHTILNVGFGMAVCSLLAANIVAAQELTLDDIFPTDRVLDIQITIAEGDWDTIRHQSRDFFASLHESRKIQPVERPYTYVDASVSIDGVEFPEVGLRKKGFLGSASTDRPSLKVKLNHTDKETGIEGLTNLTFNNNKQDESLVSQFMGYALYNAAGLPAPRCAYAKVTVNGTNLGIYSHVESVRKPLLKRAFGSNKGTLYEGPYVDFYEGWVGSFERKRGKDKPGRAKIQQLIEALASEYEDVEEAIGELVDLDSFYTAWAMEGLLGFWDSYSGNSNNFFIYLNPETDKFHFMPWGADSLFTKYTKLPDQYDPNAPISVKTRGLIAHKLYQVKSGRERYAKALTWLLEEHWNEEALLAEVDRVEVMVTPHLSQSQRNLIGGRTVSQAFDETREFIRQRRNDITQEIADGMPKWTTAPEGPFVFGASSEIWSAARYGDTEAIQQHLADGADINAIDRMYGMSPLSWAAILGHTEAVELLLQRGADVNIMDRDGSTPLHGAAFLGRTEVAQRLIENGADVNAKNSEGNTPVDVLSANWPITQFVMAVLGIEAEETKVKAGRDRIAQLLKEHGGETGAVQGDSPGYDIWGAAKNGDLEAIKQHLETGTDVDIKSPDGTSLLAWAALLGQTEVVDLLVDQGADLDAKNQDGSTPLHGAVLLGRTEAVKRLVEAGADTNVKNIYGGIPVDSITVDWETTLFIAGLLQIVVDKEEVMANRAKIAEIMRGD